MKRLIFKLTFMAMILIGGCTSLWFCAENSRHFEGGLCIFGTLFSMMGAWFYKKVKR